MMRSNQTALLTVEDFVKIPDPPGGRYELHHGELALVPPPTNEHSYIQTQLLLILARICIGWYVTMEFAFRPLPEHEVWRADAGMIPNERLQSSPRKGWISGAPDLVIEVLSSSHTAEEMKDREKTCFRGGCREFWVVDSNVRSIRVSTPDGQSPTYNIDGEIPLDQFAPGKLAVAGVFPEGIFTA